MSYIIRIYTYCFFGQPAIFEEQLLKGGFRCIHRGVSNKDFKNHFSGEKTLATHIASSKTRFSGHTVIYITNSEVSALNRLMEGASDAGLYFNQMIPEYTGGLGYHLWLRYFNPIKIEMATAIGEIILKLSNLEGQVFPERDTASDNIVTLPLGIDRKYGQRSYLFDAGLHPLEDWAAYLYTLKPITFKEACFITRKYENLNKN